MDQCKYCTVRGDFDACLNAECGHHDNWFTVELFKIIEELKQPQESAEFLVARERIGSTEGEESLYLYTQMPRQWKNGYFEVDGETIPINPSLFPSVTWESGPRKVKMILVEE